MKIGVISYLLRHHELPAAMEFLQDIGFSRVELDYRHADGLCDYHEVDASGAAHARQICERYGIAPMAYCVGGLNQNHLPHLRNVFEFARGLGVEVITGLLDPEIMAETDALCQEYGIYYAIENHRGNVFEAGDTILEALEGCSQYLGANVDTGHFIAAGLVPVDEVRKLEGRIYHVHFKDSDQRQPLGSGTADLPAVMAELKRQGYDRLLSVEHYEYRDIDDETLRTGLIQALAYVEELDRKTG
jgi:sugar phosphate isomerase/epimerase